MSFSNSSTKKNSVICYLKGLIVAMLVTFALIILLACSLKWFSLDEKYITPINLAIKTISVVIGSLIAIKSETKGLVRGILFGLLYIVLAFATFSIFAKTIVLDLSFILDVVFSCLAGGIVGILKVNHN